MKVSVVVPTKDGAERLPALLEALRRQTLARAAFEVLVVDDGSTDRTADVVRDSGIARLVTAPRPLGQGAATNLGIAAATGDVLAFTDDDTIPAADWLEAGLRAVAASPGGLVAGHVELRLAGRPTAAALMDYGRGYLDQRGYVADGFGATANLWVRRDVLERLGGFDAGAAWQTHDRDFGERARLAGLELVYAAGVVVQHPTRDRARDLARVAYRLGQGAAWLGHHGRGAVRGRRAEWTRPTYWLPWRTIWGLDRLQARGHARRPVAARSCASSSTPACRSRSPPAACAGACARRAARAEARCLDAPSPGSSPWSRPGWAAWPAAAGTGPGPRRRPVRPAAAAAGDLVRLVGVARPVHLPAPTRFVSPGGDDAGPCTRARPCQSFDRAFHVARPGTVVELAGGAYRDQLLTPVPGRSGRGCASRLRLRACVVLRPAAGATVRVGELLLGAVYSRPGPAGLAIVAGGDRVLRAAGTTLNQPREVALWGVRTKLLYLTGGRDVGIRRRRGGAADHPGRHASRGPARLRLAPARRAHAHHLRGHPLPRLRHDEPDRARRLPAGGERRRPRHPGQPLRRAAGAPGCASPSAPTATRRRPEHVSSTATRSAPAPTRRCRAATTPPRPAPAVDVLVRRNIAAQACSRPAARRYAERVRYVGNVAPGVGCEPYVRYERNVWRDERCSPRDRRLAACASRRPATGPSRRRAGAACRPRPRPGRRRGSVRLVMPSAPAERPDGGSAAVDVVVVAHASRDTLRACVAPLAGAPGVRVVVVDTAVGRPGFDTVADLAGRAGRTPPQRRASPTAATSAPRRVARPTSCC